MSLERPKLTIDHISRAERTHEAATLQAIEAQFTEEENIAFWSEVHRLFYVWDARARGDKAVKPEEKLRIARTIMFGSLSIAESAQNVGYSDQFTRDARHLLFVAAILAARKILPTEVPAFAVNMSPEQQIVYSKLLQYETEREALEDQFYKPSVSQRLVTLPQVHLLLGSYITFGTIELLLQRVQLSYTDAEIGDYNKEIRSFILGKRNQGIRRLAQRVLFQNWLSTRQGVEQGIDYNTLLTRGIQLLLKMRLPQGVTDYEKRLRSSAASFFEALFRAEYENERGKLRAAQYPFSFQEASAFAYRTKTLPRKLNEVIELYVQGESVSNITKELMGEYGYRSSQDLWTSAGLSFIEELLCFREERVRTRIIQSRLKHPTTERVASLFEALQTI